MENQVDVLLEQLESRRIKDWRFEVNENGDVIKAYLGCVDPTISIMYGDRYTIKLVIGSKRIGLSREQESQLKSIFYKIEQNYISSLVTHSVQNLVEKFGRDA